MNFDKLAMPALVEVARNKMYELRYKKSTIERANVYIWHQIINYYGKEIIFSKKMAIDFIVSKFGKNYFEEQNMNFNIRRFVRSCNLLLEFQKTGFIPNNCLIKDSISENSHIILNKYLDYCTENGNGKRTIENKNKILYLFLKSVAIESITYSLMIKYFNTFNERDRYSANLDINIIRVFLNYCFKNRIISEDLSIKIPKISLNSTKEIVTTYSTTEVKKVIDSVDIEVEFGFRDKAIILLISTLGLRATDVTLLKLSDFDWDNNIFKIIQSKTKKPKTFIITPTIGNAIIDYVLNERPKIENKYLFLTKKGTALISAHITSIVEKYFHKSGVSINGRKHSAHALRHSLATALLEKEVSIYTISNVLGHSSIESTKIYAKVNLNQLKLCALEVPTLWAK
ncbi:MAG: integrase [Haloplasmataceae bacterium]|jgi:site-specific recombinase XerD|nr:integrase [Haloplasmataceae bacterium]